MMRVKLNVRSCFEILGMGYKPIPAWGKFSFSYITSPGYTTGARLNQSLLPSISAINNRQSIYHFNFGFIPADTSIFLT
jgi:hypothetical protein